MELTGKGPSSVSGRCEGKGYRNMESRDMKINEDVCVTEEKCS